MLPEVRMQRAAEGERAVGGLQFSHPVSCLQDMAANWVLRRQPEAVEAHPLRLLLLGLKDSVVVFVVLCPQCLVLHV